MNNRNLPSSASNCRVCVRIPIACLVLTLVVSTARAAAPVWQGPDGGDFLDAANWTVQVPGSADSAVVNNDFDGTMVFSDSLTVLDLLLRSAAGKVTLDVDPEDAGQKFNI